MKRDEEFLQATPGTGKHWLLLVMLYLLLLLWLEPLIDFFLSLLPPNPDPTAIAAFNQRKLYITNVIFGIARSLPILLFLWIGYRVLVTQTLPPPGSRLPMSVRLIKGPNARFYGMFIIGVSLMLLLRELTLLSAA